MKLLVTGHDGQLARSIAERGKDREQIELVFAARPETDLAQPGAVGAAIRETRPDAVINAAAYTAVDQAEDEPDLALRINCEAAREAASAAAEVGCPIVQLSTDYVFDGQATTPYRPADPTGPLNVYGWSKLAGEEAVRAACGHHLIIRTSWLYGPFGRNFVKTMMGLAQNRDEIRVVGDQVGSPTETVALADAILLAVKVLRSQPPSGTTVHLAGSQVGSWADIANQVMTSLEDAGERRAGIVNIGTADYPSKAARPAYSALDSSSFEQAFGLALPDWRQSVDEVVRRLLAAPDGA